ncbi:sugar phosphate isomerase/epimerase family protein [Halegenticoccus tardaugens]|uniref:sugar phosphate isomerase/epimerase family protein n=1 Tax=Halegenticoccus tardaugens TaxID=2071624 RepID=UPI00100AF943|nr:sugar phosphate isomerase/epimerase family protein [Halegenticoccus tardaugens]
MPLAAFPKCYLGQLMDSKMSLDAWFDVANDIDVDGVEFYWGITPADDAAELDRLRSAAADRGLSIPMMCYSPDFTHPDPAVRRAAVEQEKRAIEVTARLGGGYCRVLSGQRRPDVSREEGLTWVSDCIGELLPHAADHEVTLVLENHYKDDYWEHPEFAQRMDRFLDLLDRIDESPWFGVNYDPSNAVIADDDPIELLEAVADRVVTMHASDRYLEGGTIEDLRVMDAEGGQGYADILQHGVVGEGMIDYNAVFSILADAGFDGWISIEDGYDAEKGKEHLDRSARYLREKMDEYGLS